MKYLLICYSDDTFKVARFKGVKERKRFIADNQHYIGKATKDGAIVEEINPVKDSRLLMGVYLSKRGYSPIPGYGGEVYTGCMI